MRPLQEEYRGVKHRHKQEKQTHRHTERKEDIGRKSTRLTRRTQFPNRFYNIVKMTLETFTLEQIHQITAWHIILNVALSTASTFQNPLCSFSCFVSLFWRHLPSAFPKQLLTNGVRRIFKGRTHRLENHVLGDCLIDACGVQIHSLLNVCSVLNMCLCSLSWAPCAHLSRKGNVLRSATWG